MGKKDEYWKHTEDFLGRTKFQTKCMFCKDINSGGIYRFKYHIAAIPGHDVTICTKQTAEAKCTCIVALEKYEQEKLNKKRQLERLRAIGSHAPASASESTSIGCVGEGSSRPPFRPSASASACACADASASRSYTEIESSLLQPRVRKNRLDSYFVPNTTRDSQPTLEGMGLNNAPYWQNMIDAVAICGPGFKAPTEAELSGYLLDEMVEDMKVELENHRKEWTEKGCTIMTDCWTDRRM